MYTAIWNTNSCCRCRVLLDFRRIILCHVLGVECPGAKRTCWNPLQRVSFRFISPVCPARGAMTDVSKLRNRHPLCMPGCTVNICQRAPKNRIKIRVCPPGHQPDWHSWINSACNRLQGRPPRSNNQNNLRSTRTPRLFCPTCNSSLSPSLSLSWENCASWWHCNFRSKPLNSKCMTQADTACAIAIPTTTLLQNSSWNPLPRT